MKKLRVLVLCGGKSAEHAVSLVSARTVWDNLDPKHYEAKLVYIDRKGGWRDSRRKLLSGRVGASEKARWQAPGRLRPSPPWPGHPWSFRSCTDHWVKTEPCRDFWNWRRSLTSAAVS